MVSGSITSRCKETFVLSKTYRPTLQPTQPPSQWAGQAPSPGLKRPRRESDHSPPTSAEVPIWLNSAHRNNSTFLSSWSLSSRTYSPEDLKRYYGKGFDLWRQGAGFISALPHYDRLRGKSRPSHDIVPPYPMGKASRSLT